MGTRVRRIQCGHQTNSNPDGLPTGTLLHPCNTHWWRIRPSSSRAARLANQKARSLEIPRISRIHSNGPHVNAHGAVGDGESATFLSQGHSPDSPNLNQQLRDSIKSQSSVRTLDCAIYCGLFSLRVSIPDITALPRGPRNTRMILWGGGVDRSSY